MFSVSSSGEHNPPSGGSVRRHHGASRSPAGEMGPWRADAAYELHSNPRGGRGRGRRRRGVVVLAAFPSSPGGSGTKRSRGSSSCIPIQGGVGEESWLWNFVLSTRSSTRGLEGDWEVVVCCGIRLRGIDDVMGSRGGRYGSFQSLTTFVRNVF